MKIKPAIRGPKNYVDFASLKLGDVFIYHGKLLIKMENVGNYEQNGFDPQTGRFDYGLCENQVLPVDAVITWTKQKEGE